MHCPGGHCHHVSGPKHMNDESTGTRRPEDEKRSLKPNLSIPMMLVQITVR